MSISLFTYIFIWNSISNELMGEEEKEFILKIKKSLLIQLTRPCFLRGTELNKTLTTRPSRPSSPLAFSQRRRSHPT